MDRFFKISERGSTVAREVRGGVVTFVTMAYIIVLNPLILGFTKDADGHFLGGGPGPDLPAIAAATALVAGVTTILMGLVANYPLALATGLGLNAFVAVSIASGMSWYDAMGLVVLEGIVILVLVLTGFRKAVFHAVPGQLKTAISVGIGLFIAFIGLVDAGVVRRIPDAANTTVPVQLGATGSPRRLAGAGLRARPGADDRLVRAERARAPSFSRSSPAPSWPWSSRPSPTSARRSPGTRSTPPAGASRSRRSRTRSVDVPDFRCWASSRSSAPSSGSARSPRCCSCSP